MKQYLAIMIFIVLLICLMENVLAQHETIPYASIDKICEKCVCLKGKIEDNRYRYVLSCPNKGLHHILPRWPPAFGINHDGMEIQVTFSENNILILQQLPPSQGIISFSCSNCHIEEIQSATFVDCPNIISLNLKYNQLTGDSLNPEIFRGPYDDTAYEPIGLEYLDLSYNLIDTLDLRLFEHTPKLKTLLLGGNKFNQIDSQTLNAIGSVKNLEYLDLSYNYLKILPDEIFLDLFRLESVFIQGNVFQFVPDALKIIFRSLQTLDISANAISNFNVSSFNEFEQLRFLNISSMMTLNAVEDGTFVTLKNLKELLCSNNLNLSKFHLPTASKELILLDISNCNLKSVILDVDLMHVDKNYWPNLKYFDLYDNPWNCDCYLMKVFEQYKHIINTEKNRVAKCSSPYHLVGTKLLNLSTDSLCEKIDSIIEMQPLRAHTFNPPYFLRPKTIGVTMVMILIVIALGILVGFGIVVMKRRLKTNLFGLNSQIRYTTVSNI